MSGDFTHRQQVATTSIISQVRADSTSVVDGRPFYYVRHGTSWRPTWLSRRISAIPTRETRAFIHGHTVLQRHFESCLNHAALIYITRHAHA